MSNKDEQQYCNVISLCQVRRWLSLSLCSSTQDSSTFPTRRTCNKAPKYSARKDLFKKCKKKNQDAKLSSPSSFRFSCKEDKRNEYFNATIILMHSNQKLPKRITGIRYHNHPKSII